MMSPSLARRVSLWHAGACVPGFLSQEALSDSGFRVSGVRCHSVLISCIGCRSVVGGGDV